MDRLVRPVMLVGELCDALLEFGRAQDFFSREFGHFVAVASKPSFGPFESEPGAPGYERTECAGLARVGPGRPKFADRCAFADHDAASVSGRRKDGVLADCVWISRVTELGEVGQFHCSLAVAFWCRPDDPDGNDRIILGSVQLNVEPRIEPVMSASPTGGREAQQLVGAGRLAACPILNKLELEAA